MEIFQMARGHADPEISQTEEKIILSISIRWKNLLRTTNSPKRNPDYLIFFLIPRKKSIGYCSERDVS